MKERPLLVIRPEAEGQRPTGPRRAFPQPQLPTPARQQERIGPVFGRLTDALDAAEAEGLVQIQATTDGLEPERTLVFEVVGALSDLAKAVANIPGIEFQIEDQLPFEPDDDFQPGGKDPEREIQGMLYACIPDLTAMRQILSLWNLYIRGEKLPRPFGKWKTLFAGLKAIRPWGPRDRLPDSTRDYLEHAVESGTNPVFLEAELWFRGSAGAREAATRTLTESAPNCVVSAQCVIAEIGYHAVIVQISPEDARALLADPAAGIGSAAGVMQIRPQSLMDAKIDDIELTPHVGPGAAPVTSATAPTRIGLLDGFPFQRHAVLNGRIVLDDPDGLDAMSPVATRVHGTAMASLILNGDLNRPTGGPRNIYVRPVLVYDPGTGEERTPVNSFPIDLIHRAVRRAKEGENGEPPTCPTVVVFNISLGDQNQPFVKRASPWAKLLDYLSFKYGVLFVVSAGNVSTPVATSIPTMTAFEALSPGDRETEVIRSLFNARGLRTMLSPAESTNSITVGASFGDSFAALDRVGHFNYSPYLTEGLPNISSGLGLGVRRSVKPDMVFEGGKERVALRTGGGTVSLVPLASGNVHFGHRVASPDNTGLLNSSSTSSGTSNAAALVTHNIARVIDALDPQGDEDSLRVPTEYLAVSAKALAIHSCKWSPAAERILEVVGPEDKSKWARRRLNVSSGIGCGTPDFDKVVECARHRAVMLHWGRLSEEQTIVFRIPVPNELSGVAEARRVSITVAWLSPINPGRAQHRMARLEIAPVDESKFWLGTSDTNLPTGDSLENGTVSQVCLVGDNVVALAHEGGMAFRVNCRAQYDSLKVSIPYAVCVSLELGAGSPIDVYSQVRNALRQRVAARVPVGA